MKLQGKIIAGISALVAAVILIISIVFSLQLSGSVKGQLELAAMDMAVGISKMPEVAKTLEKGEYSRGVQELVEPIRKASRYQYIIVMDMDGIQYSYPYESGLFKGYRNGGEERVLSSGEAYHAEDDNELISAFRAFVPVMSGDMQVGAVLVGLLTDTVASETKKYDTLVEIALLISVFMAFIVAYILSRNIKKAIFGLEPSEIALLLTERNVIIESIQRAIVAVDKSGNLLLQNNKAVTLLGDNDEALRKRLQFAVSRGEKVENETLHLNSGITALISICPMIDHSGKITGAVAGIDDLTEVRAFAEELTDYRNLVDALRAQNHEFMNKLHIISGLLQLDKKDKALTYISELANGRDRLEKLLTERIRDDRLAALILSKFNQFSEKRVELRICPDSFTNGFPKGISSDEVCMIVGNLLDNSLDAVLENGTDKVDLLIVSDKGKLEIDIYNSGNEIPYEISERIFEKGFTTKESGHGIGLHIVLDVVERAYGEIYHSFDEGVTWHVRIPKI